MQDHERITSAISDNTLRRKKRDKATATTTTTTTVTTTISKEAQLQQKQQQEKTTTKNKQQLRKQRQQQQANESMTDLQVEGVSMAQLPKMQQGVMKSTGHSAGASCWFKL